MGSVTVMVRVFCFGTRIKETRSLHCRNNRSSNQQKQCAIGRSEGGKVVILGGKPVVDVKKSWETSRSFERWMGQHHGSFPS